jgi:hypothetical protein
VAWDAWRDRAEGERRALVTVPAEQSGKLWRITRPGVQTGFVVDPRIPPYFSITRGKWFNPEA